ncbi:hypothetical protein BD626DRAFT_403109 [Schizophyllum amplum]|uniref:F-box domain-containing protein n=1 Tax=Schizophyllum amplum TaxID=97359 RepID=A0A550CE01_9AGAR|nr:hypothetical protein BD626DRAFT_403109 [Auriculariopsis ampla]
MSTVEDESCSAGSSPTSNDGLADLPMKNLLAMTSSLPASDIAALSSTCKHLRALLSPSLFSICRWNGRNSKAPPERIWPYIRYVSASISGMCRNTHEAHTQKDLSRLTSLHVSGATITPNLTTILSSATNLDTLDFSYLSWRGPPHGFWYKCRDVPKEYELIPVFPTIHCHPRVVKFCSRLGPDYREGWGYANRMRAQRMAFVTLLYQLDVARVEYLKVGLEALCLSCAVTYTWSTLRVLVLTGFWVRDPEALEDARTRTPASIYEHVHLGTLLVAAPHLRVLRVQWRGLAQRSWGPTTFDTSPPVVWPADEAVPPPSAGVLSRLREVVLHNPTLEDGIWARLPTKLHVLSLVRWPHSSFGTQVAGYHDVVPMPPGCEGQGTLTADELVDILGRVPMRGLKELRLSVRRVEDMRLFEHITKAFPRLEVLEVHAETGPDCLWTASRLADFARALAPLPRLRVLRVNCFAGVIEERTEHWPQEDTDGILKEDLINALFGPLKGVRELWLPTTGIKGMNVCWTYRMLSLYEVQRDESGRVELNWRETAKEERQ